MLTQYYKLNHNIHSYSLNCSNDVLYRFLFSNLGANPESLISFVLI